MTPRAYSMDKRAASTEETRRRIVEASLKLHWQKGFAATTWDDIARAAGVAVGTVYYHFPTTNELIPACSGFGMQLNPSPTSEVFRGARGKKQRIERLARGLFSYYESVRAPMAHTFAERTKVPAVGRFADEMLTRTRSLVSEALGAGAAPDAVTAADALLDFRVWESMRERGLDGEVIIDTITSTIDRLSSRRPTGAKGRKR